MSICSHLIAPGLSSAEATPGAVSPFVRLAPPMQTGFDAAAVEKLARTIVIDAVPDRVESAKEWGGQKSITVPKITGQGLKTRVRKEEKLVNHGLWKKYSVEPIDAKNRLKLALDRFEIKPEGGMSFRLKIATPFFARASIQQWTLGVRTLSATGEAEVVASVELDCEVGILIKHNAFLPELVLEPKILDARLDIDEFDLKKLGDLPRSLVKELNGEGKRLALKYLRSQNAKTVQRANAAITKKGRAGKLTLSPLQLIK